MTAIVNKNNCQEVLNQIEDAFYDIPFGNSAFQTEMFVIAAQITPERAYRTIGLELHQKISQLKDHQQSRMKSELKILKYKEKLKNKDIDFYEKSNLELKIAGYEDSLNWLNKLENDTIVELNILYSHFLKFPRFTREQFEKGEQVHFEQRLRRQVIGVTGAKESIINMIEDKCTIEKFEEEYAKLPEDKKQELLASIVKDSLCSLIEPKN